MRLCVSAVLLLLLALTRAAPGSEECTEYDVLKDKTQLLGRTQMLVAFTDNDLTRNVLGLISSLWSIITETQTGFSVAQFNKLNGTCLEARFNMTTSGDTIKVLLFGMMTESKLLHFSNTSLIMDLRFTTDNVTTMFQKFHLDRNMNLSPNNTSQDHNLYLISKEPELNEMDLQRFRAHAKCEGFTGEPVFLRNSSQAYCTEEESVLIQ